MALGRGAAAAAGGLGLVLAAGFVGAAPAGATLLPGASMQVSPSTVTAGGSVTVSGNGCAGDYEIQVRVGQGAPVATDGDAGDDAWSVQVPIPAGTAPGTYPVTASCDSYNEVSSYPAAQVTVLAAQAGTTSTTAAAGRSTTTTAAGVLGGTTATGAGGIPDTGAPTAPWAILGAAALGLGSVALSASHRLRSGAPAVAVPASPAPLAAHRPVTYLRRRSGPGST